MLKEKYWWLKWVEHEWCGFSIGPDILWDPLLLRKPTPANEPRCMWQLIAPAGYWIGVGGITSLGWWLWGLTWFQSAAAIVYVYLQLAQREYKQIPPLKDRFQLGWRSILYTSFNLLSTVLLSALDVIPAWIFVPYLLQWGETIRGIYYPATGVKPTRIGIRQLIVSSLFTLLFILAWRIWGNICDYLITPS